MSFVFLTREDVGEASLIYVVKVKRRSKPVWHLRMGLNIWSATDGEMGTGDKGKGYYWREVIGARES